MTFQIAGPPKRPRYFLTANDEPQGTVYFLQDENGQFFAEADWPMPLEMLAEDLQAEVVRVASNIGEPPFESIVVNDYVRDYGTRGERKPMETRNEFIDTDDVVDMELDDGEVDDLINDEFDRRARATVKCKIDGCTNIATGKASFSGLCDQHKSEEAGRRSAVGWASRQKQDGLAIRRDDLIEPKATGRVRAAEAVVDAPIVVERSMFLLCVNNENEAEDTYYAVSRFDTERDAYKAAELLVDSRDDNVYAVVNLLVDMADLWTREVGHVR